MRRHREYSIFQIMTIVLATLLLTNSGLQGEITQDDIFRPFRWRNIGPANMMGRISALDALDEDYRVVLVGSASGGVFKSLNAGITWTPIFDE
jgi:hypothetical protein